MNNINWWDEYEIKARYIPTFLSVITMCNLGKIWIEQSVCGRGGERFPTTDMLLYRGGFISKQRKEQLRRRISDISGYTFSTEEEERTDSSNARMEAREAVVHVRTKIGHGVMAFHYNIGYSFFRNLITGVAWAIIGGIGCSVIYLPESRWKPMGEEKLQV